jgi:hypothetical protein
MSVQAEIAAGGGRRVPGRRSRRGGARRGRGVARGFPGDARIAWSPERWSQLIMKTSRIFQGSTLITMAMLILAAGVLSSCASTAPGWTARELDDPAPSPPLVPVWWVGGGLGTSVAASQQGDRLFTVGHAGLAEISPEGHLLSRFPDVAYHRLFDARASGEDNVQVFVAAQGRGQVRSYDRAGALLWTHKIQEGTGGIHSLRAVDGDCCGSEGLLVGEPGSATFLGLDGQVLWRETVSADDLCTVKRGETCVALIAGGFLGLHVHELATGKRLGRLPVPLATVNDVRILRSPSQHGSDLILAGGIDRRRGWTLVALSLDGTVEGEYRLSSRRYDYIVSMAVLPSRSLVAVSLRSGTIKVIEIPSMRLVAEESPSIGTGIGVLAWVERDGAPPVLCFANGRELVGYQLP